MVATEVPMVSVAKVEAGDVLVVEYPRPLHANDVRSIEAAMRRVWPANQVIVLDGGLTMKIARPDLKEK